MAAERLSRPLVRAISMPSLAHQSTNRVGIIISIGIITDHHLILCILYRPDADAASSNTLALPTVEAQLLAAAHNVSETFIQQAFRRFQQLDTHKRGALSIDALRTHPQTATLLQTNPFAELVLMRAMRVSDADGGTPVPTEMPFSAFLRVCVLFSRAGDDAKLAFLFEAACQTTATSSIGGVQLRDLVARATAATGDTTVSAEQLGGGALNLENFEAAVRAHRAARDALAEMRF